MKIFGLTITRLDVDALIDANRGFAQEIEKLEAKLAKKDAPRDAKGRFAKKEMLDDVIGHYDDIKAASKHEEFGR